jgi:hypothetical protein
VLIHARAPEVVLVVPVAAAVAAAGVPVVVARKMQQGSLLLGQMVSSSAAAVAAAADGASFVLLQVRICVHDHYTRELLRCAVTCFNCALTDSQEGS